MQGYGQLLFLGGFMVLMWFLMIRPQQKAQKKRQAMMSGLKKGDKVVTVGGMHGQVVELGEDTVTLQVADKLNLTFNRSAVGNVKG